MRRDSPLARALPRAPTKVSPAPVVSTTFTEGAGIWVDSPLSQIRALRPPRVSTRKVGAFRPAMASPSRAGFSGTRWPKMTSNSPSLTTITSDEHQEFRVEPRAGAGLSTKIPPDRCAALRTTSNGTSSEHYGCFRDSFGCFRDAVGTERRVGLADDDDRVFGDCGRSSVTVLLGSETHLVCHRVERGLPNRLVRGPRVVRSRGRGWRCRCFSGTRG